MKPLRVRIFSFLALAFAAGYMALTLVAGPSQAGSRIKDITDFEGVRANLLIGYGLVVGLNRTGDSLSNSVFTQQSLVSMLERLGVNTRGATLVTKNVAAVMVTSTMPAFSRHGTRLDVSVSALGDATNLLGGTLLVTPLLGADGEVYAVAQGQLAVSGFTATGASGTTITKGVPTTGVFRAVPSSSGKSTFPWLICATSTSLCATLISRRRGASRTRSTIVSIVILLP